MIDRSSFLGGRSFSFQGNKMVFKQINSKTISHETDMLHFTFFPYRDVFQATGTKQLAT